MRPFRSIPALALGLLLIVAGAASGQAGPPPSVKAVLEARGRQFFYAGDPFSLKLSIGNDGTETVSNPVESGLLRGFEVRTAAERRSAPREAHVPEPRGRRSSPRIGLLSRGRSTRSTPSCCARGSTRSGGPPTASPRRDQVRMIPKYDSAKEYLARVETEAGTFSIEFFPQTAPVAVKAFIDMCNAGFYDGLTIYKIVADYLVEGGDAAGDGSGRPPFTYPAELASTPIVAGTVLMKPVSPLRPRTALSS